MRNIENVKELVRINPDYIGFIFYPDSKRFVGDNPDISLFNSIPENIKKVGVFVNYTKDSIIENTDKYKLDLVQLHGNESSEFCKELKSQIDAKIIKAFSVDEKFDFQTLNEYKSVCDYFLFDTKTESYGGSGKQFDWNILTKYDNEIPFILSGGIDLEHSKKIRELKNLNIHAIDINSRFEIEPGIKNIDKIKQFKNEL